MASIINGLFAGRSGISSHGQAIAVVGDNISNSSTIGYKASRAEFEDLMAGGGGAGQSGGQAIGSGSGVSAVNSIFEQGSFESTGRTLDLAVDGNGFFVVAKDQQRFYTRAGNFKVDSAGFVVTQQGYAVLGFSANGSGKLEPLNLNTIEQNSVATTSVAIAGNVNATSATINPAAIPVPGVAVPPTVTYADLQAVSSFSTVVDVFDSLGKAHTVSFYFFHTGANEYTVRGYVNNEDVDTTGTLTGYPRLIGTTTMTFDGRGQRTPAPVVGTPDFTSNVTWNNGSDASAVDFLFDPFTQYASNSNILSITQDGKGVGAVASISIGTDGAISALLSNGQSASIGTIGLANFASPEGLTRIGKNLLTQSIASGEPIVGKPNSGTFGTVRSGSIELSTVDIASEFVKVITLQRGFQASSRLITTINSLLNEIIQLA